MERKKFTKGPEANFDAFKYRPKKHDIPIAAPVDKLGYFGKLLRHTLLDAILVGTPVLLQFQKRRTSRWTKFMKAASFMGTEDCYTILFVLLLWIFDSRFARLFVLLMGVGFYVTGFLKTFLSLPRPPLPPVRPLEKAYDWALPSHHCLLGTVLPWYIWMYLNIHYKLTTFQLAICFTLIFLWSFNVLVSRLYLGVHSPADLVSGGVVGVVILFIWVPIDDAIDHFISQQSTDVPIQVALLYAFLVFIHPSGDPGNPSLRDSCILIGTTFGLIWGHSQRNHVLGHPALLETLPPDTPVLTIIFKSFARILSGALFIFLARTLLKKFIYMFYEILFKAINLPFYSGKRFRRLGLVPSKHYSQEFKITPMEAEVNEKADVKSDSGDENSSFSANIVLTDEDAPVSSKSKENLEFEEIYSMWLNRTGKGTFFELYLPSIPLDIDVIVTLSLYPILTYCVFEYLPRLFVLCNF